MKKIYFKYLGIISFFVLLSVFSYHVDSVAANEVYAKGIPLNGWTSFWGQVTGGSYSGTPISISANDETIYLATTSGVYAKGIPSNGWSTSWGQVSGGSYSGTPISISVNNETIYLATTSGVYSKRIPSNGWSTSWGQVTGGSYSGTPISISVNDEDIFLATTSGVYAKGIPSNGWSTSWGKVTGGSYSGTPISISVNIEDIYLATTSGVYAKGIPSNGWSTSWGQVTGGSYSGTPISISVNDEDIYLATTSGVYAKGITSNGWTSFWGQVTGGSYSGTPKSLSVNDEDIYMAVSPPDTTPPTVTYSPATGSSIFTTSSVTITATDIESTVSTLYYRWDSNSYTSVAGGTRTVTPPSTGTHILYAYATDSSANTSSPVSAIYTVTVQDTTPPTVTITSTPSTSPTNVSSIIYKFTFSENVTGFVVNDVTVTKGTKGIFNGSGSTYTLVVINSGSCTQIVSVAAGVCTDAGGNGNTAGSKSTIIDKTPPKNPSISINPTVPTKGNVIVTITYPADATVKSYNINGGVSNSYTAPFTVTSNCTVYAAGADSLGNWSGQVSYVISNIDKTPPTNPSISINPTTPTKGNVTVTITYPVDATVKSYNINGGVSNSYTAPFTVSSNCTVYAAGADAAGNWSGQVSYVISNIDKTPPTNPSISINPTTPTKGNVTVTITYPADATVKSYNINGGVSNSYTAPFTLSSNCTVYAAGADAAGNWSGQVSYVISNIDKTPPANPSISINPTTPTKGNVTVTITYPADATVKSYNINGGVSNSYTAPFTASSNCTVYAAGADSLGNWSGQVSYVISNIDKTPPVDPTISINPTTPTSGNVTVTITYPADATVKSYNINGGVSNSYTAPFTVISNCTVYATGADAVGNWSNEVLYKINNIHIIPTVNTPTIDQEIYLGKDLALSATGTNINTANYKIFYTNEVTAPSITNAVSPGVDWKNSGITDNMVVGGTTDLSQLIYASSFTNVDWTFVTLGVEVISSTGDKAYGYTEAKSLIDINNIIGYIGHNQIIRIFESGRELVVSKYDEPVAQYNPNSEDISNLKNNNIFEDAAPIKYRSEFDVLKPSKARSINVYFDYNFYNKQGIETVMSTMKLQRLNSDGTVALLQTFTGSNIKKEIVNARNRYYITIDGAILSSTPQRYFVEYSGFINIKPDYIGSLGEITNIVEIEIITPTNSYGDIADEKSPNRKFDITTKVTRKIIKYQ